MQPYKLISFAAVLLGAALLSHAAYIPLKAAIAQVLLEQAWARGVKTGKPHNPWASMDARPIAKLSAPHLGKSDIVMDSATGQALAFGPSHVTQSASPGRSGLSVIAAHKNTHFSYVKNLRLGDPLLLEDVTGALHTYKVTSMDVVDADQSNIFPSQSGPSRLALVTCYPFDALSYGGPLRYVVYAEKRVTPKT